MANNGTSIYGSVRASDIREVLSASAKDISALCALPNINKWSLSKPCRYPSIDAVLSDAQKKSIDHGMAVRQYSSVRAAAEAVNDGSAMWAYLPPRGGASEPYRYGDYQGYNHAAAPWFEFEADNDASIETISISGGESLDLLPQRMQTFDFLSTHPFFYETYVGFLLYRVQSNGLVATPAIYMLAPYIDIIDAEKQWRIRHSVVNEYFSGPAFALPIVIRPATEPSYTPSLYVQPNDQAYAGQIYPMPAQPMSITIKTQQQIRDELSESAFAGITAWISGGDAHTASESSLTFSGTLNLALASGMPSGRYSATAYYDTLEGSSMVRKTACAIGWTTLAGGSETSRAFGVIEAEYLAAPPTRVHIWIEVLRDMTTSMPSKEFADYIEVAD